MDVSVIGAGYVGIVTAVCLADRGHNVTLIEADPTRLGVLLEGRALLHEPRLGAPFTRPPTQRRLHRVRGVAGG